MAQLHHNSIVQTTAEITVLQALSPGYFLLSVCAPEIARVAVAGQFAQVRVMDGLDPLLARPLSIYYASAESGEVNFLFKVVGRGTSLLASRQVGERLRVLGPLGNGFSVPETASSVALIAGGVGMPPLYFLARMLRRARPGCAMTLFYGGRGASDLLELPRWEAQDVAVSLATDDGSAGHHGLVTAALLAHLSRAPVDYLAACGPLPMLRAVQRIALATGIRGELALEARMACGVGACLGCVCATIRGNRRVCVDGPIFALDEVSFDG
jgi:dihydroorotate dehydrogenase electron transfer subunit